MWPQLHTMCYDHNNLMQNHGQILFSRCSWWPSCSPMMFSSSSSSSINPSPLFQPSLWDLSFLESCLWVLAKESTYTSTLVVFVSISLNSKLTHSNIMHMGNNNAFCMLTFSTHYWNVTIVMTFLVWECYGSPKKQEF